MNDRDDINATLREIAADFHRQSLSIVEAELTKLAEARALLAELVAGPPEHDWPLWYYDESCVFCGAAATERLTEWRVDCEHTPDCIVTRIRAYLGKDKP